MAFTQRNSAGAAPLVSVVIPRYSAQANRNGLLDEFAVQNFWVDRAKLLRDADRLQLKALDYFYRCDRALSQERPIALAQLLQTNWIEPPIKPLTTGGTRRGKPPD